ncbi:TIGR03085 family protein [Kineococcus sp. T13]|nr:TIGR03085 family protein [Kineococcus vitellinus]
MAPVTDARREREGLCDTALAVGPDAPTLCRGWDVRDLLVHLLVRDSRPDVALGSAVPPLRGRSELVLSRLREQPFAQLVEGVRSGPRGPLRLSGVDELVNRAEFFVHHEDIRRAQDDWRPRRLPGAETHALWRTVRLMGRVAYRQAGTGVVLVTPDGPRAVVRSAEVAVSLTGEPGDLLLHAFGRRSRARVQVGGQPAAVQRFLDRYPADDDPLGEPG